MMIDVEAFVAAGYSRKTIAVYLTALRRLDAWLSERGIELASAPLGSVVEYAETLPHTRSSRALLRSSLRAFWSTVGRAESLAAIRVPSHPRMRCLALEDIAAARLAAAARARGDLKGLAVLFGLYAGLRRNEIARLRWRDIDQLGWVTLVGKGDVTRALPLHRVLLESARSVRAGLAPPPDGSPGSSPWVFPGRWGGPVNPTTIWLWVRAVAHGAGLPPIPTHVLRHTCLATALDATRDLRAVQELAGHARPETTAGYTRVRRDRLVDAVSAIEYG
jgi:integrase